ncbi:MAG: PHP domain-containing protein [Gemmatimonadota bacterium]
MRIDLHIHSTASDGALSPEAVAAAAFQGDLNVIALADHDTVAGVPPLVASAPPGLRVVPAIEISASGTGGERHILGYGIDVDSPVMERHAAEARVMRADRMREMIAALGRLGVEVEPARVEGEAAGAPLARPHLARVLVALGYVQSHGEAFARYLGDDAPAYVPADAVSVADAIQRIDDAGGLSIWAHPPPAASPEELDGYVSVGLDGIETYRPRQTREATRRVVRLARSRGLLTSGGSDWHGPWDVPLGTFSVDADEVGELLARLAVPRAGTSPT